MVVCESMYGAMPRTARLDTPGLLHHVMIRGIERRKIFTDDVDREDLIKGGGRSLTEKLH